MVVIARQPERRLQGRKALDAALRVRAVADGIAQEPQRVPAARVLQNGLKRFHVGVDVRKDDDLHG